jgi:hypothetical protein
MSSAPAAEGGPFLCCGAGEGLTLGGGGGAAGGLQAVLEVLAIRAAVVASVLSGLVVLLDWRSVKGAAFAALEVRYALAALVQSASGEVGARSARELARCVQAVASNLFNANHSAVSACVVAAVFEPPRRPQDTESWALVLTHVQLAAAAAGRAVDVAGKLARDLPSSTHAARLHVRMADLHEALDSVAGSLETRAGGVPC